MVHATVYDSTKTTRSLASVRSILRTLIDMICTYKMANNMVHSYLSSPSSLLLLNSLIFSCFCLRRTPCTLGVGETHNNGHICPHRFPWHPLPSVTLYGTDVLGLPGVEVVRERVETKKLKEKLPTPGRLSTVTPHGMDVPESGPMRDGPRRGPVS